MDGAIVTRFEDFDWTAEDALGEDFTPRVCALQEQEPTFWSAHQQGWLITRYADVEAGLRDPRLSAKRTEAYIARFCGADALAQYPLFNRNITTWLFNIDAPEHLRLRKLVMKPFSASAIAEHRGFAETVFQELLREVGDEPLDILNDLTLNYPSRVLIHIMGLSDVVTAVTLRRWAHIIQFGAALATPDNLAQAEAVCEEMETMLREQIAIRRARPTGDLLSALVDAHAEGQKLSEAEIVSLFQIILIGGFETTANTISLAVAALDRFPEQRAYLEHNRAEFPAMLDELNRQTAMLGMINRIAREDIESNGKIIRKGDMIYLMIGAANWDRAVFDEPDLLRFGLKRKTALTFAPGIHHCLGHFLAKMQIEVALTMLTDRFSRIELLTDRIRFQPLLPARTPASVPVRFHPR